LGRRRPDAKKLTMILTVQLAGIGLMMAPRPPIW
jgi:hypothetical protein